MLIFDYFEVHNFRPIPALSVDIGKMITRQTDSKKEERKYGSAVQQTFILDDSHPVTN